MEDFLFLNVLKSGEIGTKEMNIALSNMIKLMSQGKDITSIDGDVIKLLTTSFLPFKKVIYSYLIRYADNLSNFNIMASNMLLKEFCDPNPHLRRLSFKTLCSISCLRDRALQVLPQALKDNNSYVRKSVALCCPQLTAHHNSHLNSFVNSLYEKLSDSDSSIIVNSLISLNEMLLFHGGISMNFKLFEYLLSKLHTFEEWNWSTVCEILQKYEPKCDTEVYFTLNFLDDILIKRNPLIFIPCMELALSLVHFKHENLKNDIIEHAFVALRQSLITCSCEVTYFILKLYEKLIPICKDKLSTVYKQLLCRYSDPPFLKVKKLFLLPQIINENNEPEICEEILSHCIDSQKVVQSQAIKSIVYILKLSSSSYLQCIEVLLQFMELDFHGLTDEIMEVFSSINLMEIDEKTRYCIFTAVSKHSSKIKSQNGKGALLWIIGNYGKFIDHAPHIIEIIFKEMEIPVNQHTMTALLVASVKLFFFFPAQMQLLLGEILEVGRKSNVPLIKNQASFYHCLLRIDPMIAKSLLQCDDSYCNKN